MEIPKAFLFVLFCTAFLACSVSARQDCINSKAFKECRKLKCDIDTLPTKYAPIGAVFQNFTTHNAWVASSAKARDFQKAWVDSAGMGPWKKDGLINTTANYCGCKVKFLTEVSLTESRTSGINPSWEEVFFPNTTAGGPNFFSDWLAKAGELSIPYAGLAVKIDSEGKALIAHQQFLEFLDEYDISIIFHFGWDAPGGKNAYFLQIGCSYREVVFVNPTSGPIFDPVSPDYTNPAIGGVPVYVPRAASAA